MTTGIIMAFVVLASAAIGFIVGWRAHEDYTKLKTLLVMRRYKKAQIKIVEDMTEDEKDFWFNKELINDA